MRAFTQSRMRVQTLAATAATLVAVIASGGAACAEDAAPKPLSASTKITITGHGWGHGHGMAQWGAQGAALKGKTYNQILSFYYPGTKQGKAGGNVRALVSADTTPDVVVQARTKLVARALSTGRAWDLTKLHPHATRFRIVPTTGGRTALAYLTTGWHRMATVNGDMTFYAKGQPIRLYLPHGSAEYRGTLRSTAPVKGKWNRDTVNILSLDNYLKGVVPGEVYPTWQPAALRAQAIAARSYAAFQRDAGGHGYYDVVDTTGDQVYKGYDAEVASTNAAVTATAGMVRTSGGKPAYTQFSASNGGFMLKGSKPYLVSKKDPYDTKASGDKNVNWTRTLTVKQIQKAADVGKVVSMAVTKRVAGTGGRYVAEVTIVGTTRTAHPSGETLKSWFGLNSSWFDVSVPKS
ncbi:SpoIID/LytB domain-containing protein [Nocardioides sp. DS6]|uniref:SpoIID/LytB domain-containing protein n=1 Tax=Nocardioides eburneus TaxID=3231482 RepID=A0ABV3T0T0_9ACTN